MKVATDTADRFGQTWSQRLRPYPEYKDSGVAWLAEIPVHWEIAPLYARYDVALGKMLDAKRITGHSLGRYLRNIDVQWDAVNVRSLPEMDFVGYERERYLLRAGDLLVCEGGEAGRTAIWRAELDECFYQKAIHRVRPRGDTDLPRFFFFLMYALAKRGVFVRGSNPTTIDHLTAVQLRRYRMPFPTTGEQRAITGFLDRETARIDALVARKERLIELLQEKRTALITQAVTRGLDPNVTMKDSGVDWLGQIPAHWEIAPVYARYEVSLGKMLDAKRITGNSSGRYLRNVDVQWDAVNVRDLPEMDFPRGERERYLLRPGDLLVCEGGEAGRTAIWRGLLDECFYQKAIHRVRPRSDSDLPRFFYFLMYALAKRRVFAQGSSPTTIEHLTATQLRHYRLPFPTTREQSVIAAFLDRETAVVDVLIAKIQKAASLLKELRTALISAAVTGKIDVRNESS